MTSRKPLNKHLRVQVLLRDESRCRICGRSKDEVALEVDHIIPVSEGGTDEISNLATLCHDCNLGKSNYRFKDYTSMDILPEGIELHIHYYHDDKIGDYDRYHLYCYYTVKTASGPIEEKYHIDWKITRGEFKIHPDHNAYEARRKEEETTKFIEDIRKQLAGERKRLVLIEGKLYKV